MVVKTSEVTPLTCAMLARLWTESDDAALPPPGTFSVLAGLGTTVGAALTSSPLCDIVSMTGSALNRVRCLGSRPTSNTNPLRCPPARPS